MCKYSVKFYNEFDNIGNLCYIVVCCGYYIGEMMVVLIMRILKLFLISKIVLDILEVILEVVSIV